jgi:hypothetical protein
MAGEERLGPPGCDPVGVYHVELAHFPHQAHAFNLSPEELDATMVRPWVRGEVVEFGERRWSPERAKLTIYEGPELPTDEMSMGRGWPNVTRSGVDVTDRILAAATRQAQGGPAESAVAAFKEAVLAECGDGRIGIHQVVWLANARYGQSRVSERLALSEQSVWELLHERRLVLLRAAPAAGETVPIVPDDWQAALLSWATWADPGAPTVFLEGTRE